jgi:hypothetical protein
MENSQVIKVKYSGSQIRNLTDVFQDTPPNSFASPINMARCIDKMEGNRELGFTHFKELVSKSSCGSRDESLLTQFYSENHASLDALRLITPASEKYFFLEMQKRYLSINAKIESTPRLKLESIDLSYRQTCADRFDLFSLVDLTPLKNVLLSMEYFPDQTYILVYPYLGSLLELSVFTASFACLSDNFFFESLFRNSIDRLEHSVPPFKDTVPYTYSRKFLIGAVLSSSIASAVFGYCYGLGTEVLPAVDALDPYKFTGQLGAAIKSFEENSGALLYTVSNVLVTYIEIFVLTLIEPYEGLGDDLKDMYSQIH